MTRDDLSVSISSHAYNRDFNDKADHDDMLLFSKKLIMLYSLYNDSFYVGFYKFTDGDITAVIKKETKHNELEFILITLYNKNDSYLALNINVRDFRCMYEGVNNNDRLHEKIYKITKPKKVHDTVIKYFNDISKEEECQK